MNLDLLSGYNSSSEVNLTINKSVNTTNPTKGYNISYIIVVVNTDPDRAISVVVRNVLDLRLILIGFYLRVSL